MSRWTDSAKAKLEQYFANMRRSLNGSGADAEEVTEDLRRHLEQEVAARKLAVVTEEDVTKLLIQIGAPESATAVAEPPPTPSAPAPTPVPPPRKLPGWWMLFFGVLLPLGAIVFEVLSGACAGLFFDPLPTMAHTALAAFVPLANLLVWLAVRRGALRRLKWLSWANGAAVAVSFVFMLAFLPLSALAVVTLVMIFGLLFYGIGLAPLAPAFSFACALRLRRHLRLAAGEEARLPGWWPGLALGLGAVLLFTVPTVITDVALDLAASDNPATSTRGVRMLRWCDMDEELLRACYGRGGRSDTLFAWRKSLASETARTIYYRVHGQPFNAVPPPKLYAGQARWDVMEQDFTWDNDQGGDAVAGRVLGLSLVNSRQDAVLDPDAALAYIEWTLEFKNTSTLQRESRAQILLPPGGVVSRLTLWIDGEEREAAFGGRSQVKTAYKEVVHQRRDPVMVTTAGPDRVLVQCFPVPPNGGKMKVRLGITAPLVLTAADSGSLCWPCFAERNFTLSDALRHAVWVESPRPLESRGSQFKREAGKNGSAILRGELSERELAAPGNSIRAQRPATAVAAWTRDTRLEGTPLVRQTIVAAPAASPDRVILVVDGTRGMEATYPGLCSALTLLPTNIDFALLLARDGCEELIPLQKGTPELYRKAAHCQFKSAGGHDNLPALLRAWDLATAAKAGAIVWVHGPQPVLMDSVETLRQRFERSGNPPLLFDVEAQTGPNRIADALDGFKTVRSVARLGEVGEDLGRLFGTWTGRTPTFEFQRERLAAEASATTPPGKETSLHLARLWAAGEVARLREARHTDEAMALAASHQLVTPVSGAVVLETQAQYERAGLQPASPASVPVVPEPSASALLLLGLLLLLAPRLLARRAGSCRSTAD
jgi:hypothetical protein